VLLLVDCPKSTTIEGRLKKPRNIVSEACDDDKLDSKNPVASSAHLRASRFHRSCVGW